MTANDQGNCYDADDDGDDEYDCSFAFCPAETCTSSRLINSRVIEPETEDPNDRFLVVKKKPHINEGCDQIVPVPRADIKDHRTTICKRTGRNGARITVNTVYMPDTCKWETCIGNLSNVPEATINRKFIHSGDHKHPQMAHMEHIFIMECVEKYYDYQTIKQKLFDNRKNTNNF